MSALDDLNLTISNLNSAADAVVAKIQSLNDQISTGNSEAQIQAATQSINDIIVKLNSASQ